MSPCLIPLLLLPVSTHFSSQLVSQERTCPNPHLIHIVLLPTYPHHHDCIHTSPVSQSFKRGDTMSLSTSNLHSSPSDCLHTSQISRLVKGEELGRDYTSFTWFSVLGLRRMDRLLCLRKGFFSRQNSLRTELERRSKMCLHLSNISCPILVSHSNTKSLKRFSP